MQEQVRIFSASTTVIETNGISELTCISSQKFLRIFGLIHDSLFVNGLNTTLDQDRKVERLSYIIKYLFGTAI